MYYQHSGRYTFGGLIVGLVSGTISALVLAYAYARGSILIPEVHLAAFATLFFGGLVGLATGWGLVRGKVRNQRVALVVTALVSTFALYSSWAMWIAAVGKRWANKDISWAILAQHPVAVWTLMKWINHYGTWSLDNSGSATSATKGLELWFIWAGEALLIVGVATAAGFAVVRQRPFCEACNRWCRDGARVLLAPPPDAQQLKLQVESNDLRPLEALGPGSKTDDHLIVALHSCDQCNQFHTLTLTQMSMHRKKFGHPRVSSKTIIRQLVVGPGEAQTLRQLSEKVAQAPKLAPERARGAAVGGKR